MVGNFRLANKFATVYTRQVYEDVFFDRFNSIFKGFYLLVGQKALEEMVSTNSAITFIKVPSTERFGSQDVTLLEYFDPNLLTPDQRKLICILNSVVNAGSYRLIDEYNRPQYV